MSAFFRRKLRSFVPYKIIVCFGMIYVKIATFLDWKPK